MMDDVMLMQYYTAHVRSLSGSFPGSRFGQQRGTSMNASAVLIDWRSRFGAQPGVTTRAEQLRLKRILIEIEIGFRESKRSPRT